ncbi:MAG: DUF2064 domain-containing protein [Candidatus Dadabacteria bacterium]|nr:DUF2064 domain-containing protein [Candidatus Dadabacteria bacterium]NIQ16352.1 DUF2064 domain-containing protein [Candidatus Dadabacteria bacterium]
MKNNSNPNALIIFVKYPTPGEVKTRLGKSIGYEKAASLYSLIAKFIINKLTDSKSYTSLIFYSPENKKEEVKKWLNRNELEYFPQTGNSLGEKISNAFKHCFSSGKKNVAIVGTDCIEINEKELSNVFGMLSENNIDVILGPSLDGGYYLLGLNKYRNKIFNNIEWSTNKVLNKTINIINENNLLYQTIEEKNDIDQIEDIKLNKIEIFDKDLSNSIRTILSEN